MLNNLNNITKDDFISYLKEHGIYETKERGDEVSFPCPFSSCDDDHRNGEEFHCSFNVEKHAYHCLKCGADGNFITLLKYFGDYEEYRAARESGETIAESRRASSLESIVRKVHKDTRESEAVRSYFNGRGINDSSIDEFMLGLGKFGNYQGFVIPVLDRNGKVTYVKIRRTDDTVETLAEAMNQKVSVPKYTVYPAGSKLLLVGEDQLVISTSSDVLICEGELDRIIAIQEGVKMPIVTGGGAQTFKDEWIESLESMRNIYLCMDNDETGESAVEKLAQCLAERIPTASIYKITLPFDSNTHADLTDYFVEKRGTAEELFSKYSEFYCGAKPIDPTKFQEITVEDIANVLDLTIKHDFVNKVVTFLVMLLAYTESDQQNVMFNAASSTGKTYICNEVSKYFPPQDVLVYGKTTPTAFYYSGNLRKKDKKTGQDFIDLERRILIFTEQPDTKLQENIRALLSHDSKRIPFAITNKGNGGKNVAAEGYMLGYPSTFFCSANMRIDEQEQTRCLILSPESSSEKVMAGIDTSITKNSHKNTYDAKVNSNEGRNQLMERIAYVKSLKVSTIDIDDSEYLKSRFMEGKKSLLPKTQREISHFMSLVKAMALVNAPFRMVDDKIIATNKDVDEAMKLWTPLSKSMSYGISPQTFDFYKDVILSAYNSKNAGRDQKVGIAYSEICTEYYNRNGSYPNVENIRKQYIPALQTAALVSCDKDENDKRKNIITPLVFFDDEPS